MCDCKDQVYHQRGCEHWKPILIVRPEWEADARAEFGDLVRYMVMEDIVQKPKPLPGESEQHAKKRLNWERFGFFSRSKEKPKK